MEDEIIIERHTPIDGDYYLITLGGKLFAKAYTLEDAKIISQSKILLELAEVLVEFIRVSESTGSWNLICDEEIRISNILKKVEGFLGDFKG